MIDNSQVVRARRDQTIRAQVAAHPIQPSVKRTVRPTKAGGLRTPCSKRSTRSIARLSIEALYEKSRSSACRNGTEGVGSVAIWRQFLFVASLTRAIYLTVPSGDVAERLKAAVC